MGWNMFSMRFRSLFEQLKLCLINIASQRVKHNLPNDFVSSSGGILQPEQLNILPNACYNRC